MRSLVSSVDLLWWCECLSVFFHEANVFLPAACCCPAIRCLLHCCPCSCVSFLFFSVILVLASSLRFLRGRLFFFLSSYYIYYYILVYTCVRSACVVSLSIAYCVQYVVLVRRTLYMHLHLHICNQRQSSSFSISIIAINILLL